MTQITIKLEMVNGEFTIPGLITLGQAREVLGFKSADSVYKKIRAGVLRCAYVSPEHSTRRILLFKKDVWALKKKREAELKNKLEKLEADE